MLNHLITLAIPSPDLVIGVFATVTQILGLLTAGITAHFLGERGRGRRARAGRLVPVLGGLWLATALGFGLYVLWESQERSTRLHRNLNRPSPAMAEAGWDASARTLAFSDQLIRADGIGTGELDSLLEEGQQGLVIDVREPEEIETGKLDGSQARRYPDLLGALDAGTYDLQGVILVCHSGNRSSGLAARHFLVALESRQDRHHWSQPVDGSSRRLTFGD